MGQFQQALGHSPIRLRTPEKLVTPETFYDDKVHQFIEPNSR